MNIPGDQNSISRMLSLVVILLVMVVGPGDLSAQTTTEDEDQVTPAISKLIRESSRGSTNLNQADIGMDHNPEANDENNAAHEEEATYLRATPGEEEHPESIVNPGLVFESGNHSVSSGKNARVRVGSVVQTNSGMGNRNQARVGSVTNSSTDQANLSANVGVISQHNVGLGNTNQANIASTANSSVGTANSNVNVEVVNQVTMGHANRNQLNLGSVNNGKVGSLNVNINTGVISQSSAGNGNQNTINVGSVSNVEVGSHSANISLGDIILHTNGSGTALEVNIGSAVE